MVLVIKAAGKYKSVSSEYVFIFSLTIVFFVWTRIVLSGAVVRLTQKLLWELRIQILNLIVKADYYSLSGRKHKLYSTLVHDVTTLTQASINIIDFSAALVVTLSCLVYLSFISFKLFLVTVFTIMI